MSRCASRVGAHNAPLVQQVARELLGVHPFLDSIEPDLQDPACVHCANDALSTYCTVLTTDY